MAQITHDGRAVHGLTGIAQAADKSVVFTSKEGKEYQIWKTGPEGGSPQRLLNDSGSAIVPTLSPDGKYIVFVRQKEKTSRIWRMNADGSNAVQMSEAGSEFVDFHPQITPDGRSIIFQRAKPSEDRSIFMTMPVEGGRAEVLFDRDGWSMFNPRISPDGKRIAFATYDMKSYEKRLQVASLSGNTVGPVEHDMEYNLVSQFTWSPDGKDLTILTTRDGTPNIYRQPLDGSTAAALTSFKSGRIFNFAWSANGRELLLARGNTVNDLLLIRDAGRTEETNSTMARAPRRQMSLLERVTTLFTRVRQ
jgi:Tol biopolymer transport system component